MTPLGREIAARIASAGALPVDEFMRLCLAHPEHGYYRKQMPVGAAGDFITAPEISQVFGELIGLWAAEVWSAMGRPGAVHLVELGPGRGTLMADALRAVSKVAPAFRAALYVHLVEINPSLRQLQDKALRNTAPEWHDDFDSIPDGPLIVIANEFFDALPVRQLVRTAQGWCERVVVPEGDGLRFASGAPLDHGAEAPVGSILELAPERDAQARAIAQRIATQRGAALFIDYGPLASGFGDTLQAVRDHKKVDPLAEPGLADLTTHVDFAALAAVAHSAGVQTHGPVPQGVFLQRLGVMARAATLVKNATPQQAAALGRAIGRLIEPEQMGTLFKVLALTDRLQPLPPGFDPSP
jgi:NADH dehydrogenase [ubiquinone] 1 alpha subcomplex assembly factor 7